MGSVASVDYGFEHCIDCGEWRWFEEPRKEKGVFRCCTAFGYKPALLPKAAFRFLRGLESTPPELHWRKCGDCRKWRCLESFLSRREAPSKVALLFNCSMLGIECSVEGVPDALKENFEVGSSRKRTIAKPDERPKPGKRRRREEKEEGFESSLKEECLPVACSDYASDYSFEEVLPSELALELVAGYKKRLEGIITQHWKALLKSKRLLRQESGIKDRLDKVAYFGVDPLREEIQKLKRRLKDVYEESFRKTTLVISRCRSFTIEAGSLISVDLEDEEDLPLARDALLLSEEKGVLNIKLRKKMALLRDPARLMRAPVDRDKLFDDLRENCWQQKVLERKVAELVTQGRLCRAKLTSCTRAKTKKSRRRFDKWSAMTAADQTVLLERKELELGRVREMLRQLRTGSGRRAVEKKYGPQGKYIAEDIDWAQRNIARLEEDIEAMKKIREVGIISA
jgi:hypothetical protein